jgi:glycosyltransferase involved in cell wall biosynthesis
LGPKAVRQPAVFAYSYGALEILQVARQAGCPTVLGQIDPGPEEDELVAKIAARHGLARDASGRPPAQYWDRWRTECALADVVLVNSRWSADLVAQAGVDPKKIQVCPLAYEHHDATQPIRQYPKSFSPDRPLRVLFLGQAGVRKGTLELLEAMSRLKDVPVHLTIVGPAERPVLSRLVGLPQVDWKPQVPRSQVSACYQDADVFILPTHSDGFALTQLEAQAQALPLIASRFCGDVVQDGDSGYLLEAVSPDAIAAMLRRIIAYPCALQAMSDRAPLRASAFTSARAVDILEGALDVRGL